MDAGEALEAASHAGYAGRDRCDAVAFEELVIDVKGDKWVGEFAKILLECGRDSVDVKVRIGDVVVRWVLFETFSNLLDLRATARFAIDTFHVHA